MKLKDLAAKPQLTEIIINDESIVEKYGEELQFFVHDRFSMETFTKMAAVEQTDPAQLYNIVKDLILDEEGTPVMNDGHMLPLDVMNAAVIKVTEQLGK